MRTAFRKTNNLFHLIATMTVLYIPIIALCSILALGVLAHQYINSHNGAPAVQHIAKSEYAPFPYKEPEPLKAPEMITEQVYATDEELIDTNSSEYESNTGNNEVSEIIAEPAATESISPEIEANETENTENTITPEQIQESAIETSEPEAAEAVITEVSTQPAAPAVVSLIPMRYDPDVSAEDLNRYFALLSLEPAEVQTALTNWGLVIELSNRGLYSEGHAGQYYPRHIGINTKSNKTINMSVNHEIGHCVDDYIGAVSGLPVNAGYTFISTIPEFQAIYVEEIGNAHFPSWNSFNSVEFFAESYRHIIEHDTAFMARCPKATAFIKNVVYTTFGVLI